MRFRPLKIPEVVLVEPTVHGDARGFFMETWRENVYAEHGIGPGFVQDNHSASGRHTLRGLHYQLGRPQGKLARVIRGEVWDVAVDLRRGSPTFARWVGERLSAENARQMWIPPGFAHGFLVLSERAEFLYKCTDYYAPEEERCIRWDDPSIRVDWPLPEGTAPLLSARDAGGVRLDEADLFP